jgi:hypothetical protein
MLTAETSQEKKAGETGFFRQQHKAQRQSDFWVIGTMHFPALIDTCQGDFGIAAATISGSSL